MARERDLADVVQELRVLGWKVAVGLKARPAHWNIDLLDQSGTAILVAELRALGEPLAVQIADAYEKILVELQTDPPMPSEHDLLLRYVRGEIGDRTVKYLLNIDSFELIDLCIGRGLSPIHSALPRDNDCG